MADYFISKAPQAQDVVWARWFDNVWRMFRSQSFPSPSKTASFTMPWDYFYFPVDTTSGNVTVTLPSAKAYIGKTAVIKKMVAANSVIVACSGSDTIDGAASYTFSAQYQTVTVISDGISKWNIVADGGVPSAVLSVNGTANRITVSPTTGATVVDIAATYVGQTSITTLGTISTGVWNGTAVTTSFTQAQVISVSGTANRISVGGTGTNPTVDISASYVGQATITTLGTISTGTWNATKIGLAVGGTNADLSLTGGASQFLRQNAAGAAITVIQPNFTDLAGTLANAQVNNAVVYTNITGVGTLTSGTWNATTIGLAKGGTNADLSATGGTSQFLRQNSAGAAITVVQPAASDLSNGTTGSGAVVLASSPTLTANLTFSGASARILADFSNATVLSRTLFQSSTVNGNTSLAAIPNGSATLTSFTFYGGTDPTNAAFGNIVLDTVSFRLITNKTGTGTTVPIELRVGSQNVLQGATNNDVILGTSGTTTMAAGLVYIPAAAGAPTGVPTTRSGWVPMYYDTTNNNFYIYNGAWKKVLLA